MYASHLEVENQTSHRIDERFPCCLFCITWRIWQIQLSKFVQLIAFIYVERCKRLPRGLFWIMRNCKCINSWSLSFVNEGLIERLHWCHKENDWRWWNWSLETDPLGKIAKLFVDGEFMGKELEIVESSYLNLDIDEIVSWSLPRAD